jgi:DNA-binding CsgD family transcriptional regulator
VGNPNPLIDDTALRIVALLSEGYTAPQIAAKLGYGERTISSRISKLRALTGARTTAHLVAIAFRRRWLNGK